MQSSAVTVAFRTEVPIKNFPLQTPGIIFAIIDTVWSQIQWGVTWLLSTQYVPTGVEV